MFDFREEAKTQHFRGERVDGPFCPQWVQMVTRYDSGETDAVELTPDDWDGEDWERRSLANLMLKYVPGQVLIPDEVIEWFAAEVLAVLPQEGWELSFEEVRKWKLVLFDRYEKKLWEEYPAKRDPDADEELPGDDLELLRMVQRIGLGDSVEEKLKGLGMIDETGEA